MPGLVWSRLLDLWEIIDLAAGFEDRQTAPCFPLDEGRSHTAPLRQIAPDLAQAFAELTRGSGQIIALLMMIESDREVDQALEEPAFGLLGRGPYFFENLVTLEKLGLIEMPDAQIEQFLRIARHTLAR